MKRAVLIMTGLLLLVLGLGAATAGTGIVAAVGSDGAYSANAGKINGDGRALVLNDFTVNTGGNTDVVTSVADLTASVSAANGKDVFIGVGPAADVTKYLQNVQRDVVSDVSGDNARLIPIPGDTAPAPADQQSFWTSSATGSAPTIKLDPAGRQAMVIMMADGSQPVNVNLKVGIASSMLFPMGIGLIVAGLLLILLAIWAFVGARRNRKYKSNVITVPEPVAVAPTSAQQTPAAPVQPAQPEHATVGAGVPTTTPVWAPGNANATSAPLQENQIPPTNQQ